MNLDTDKYRAFSSIHNRDEPLIRLIVNNDSGLLEVYVSSTKYWINSLKTPYVLLGTCKYGFYEQEHWKSSAKKEIVKPDFHQRILAMRMK